MFITLLLKRFGHLGLRDRSISSGRRPHWIFGCQNPLHGFKIYPRRFLKERSGSLRVQFKLSATWTDAFGLSL